MEKQTSKQVTPINNSRKKPVVNEGNCQVPWADSEWGQVTSCDLRDQKSFVKEVGSVQWPDAGGGLQDMQSGEGQREQHEQRPEV